MRETLEFFTKGSEENLEDQTFRFPWQNIHSVHEKDEKFKMEAKAKEELLLGDGGKCSVSDTLEELSVGKGVPEPKSANTSKQVSLDIFQ